MSRVGMIQMQLPCNFSRAGCLYFESPGLQRLLCMPRQGADAGDAHRDVAAI